MLSIIDRQADTKDVCINDADALRQFGPMNPGTALEFERLQAEQIRKDEQDADPKTGNVFDALGGAIHGVTGAHIFGNKDTREYTAESTAMGIVSLIPIDPEGLGKDLIEGGERVAADVGEHDGERVIRYGDQPTPRPAGTQAHHIFQHAAVDGLVSRDDAPSILLNRADHQAATTFLLRADVGGTLGSERDVAVDAMVMAGYSPSAAQRIVEQAWEYYESRGYDARTPTRVPRRPHFRP